MDVVQEAFFVTSVKVRMSDADLASRAYVSRFFEWSHQALEDLMVAADDRLDIAFAEEGWGMPLVHAEATIFGKVTFAQELEVRLCIEKIGARSLNLGFDFLDKSGACVATTTLVHTFVNLADLSNSIEVPLRLLDVFRRLNMTEP